MENVYKKINKSDINSRQQVELISNEKQQVDNILSEFITKFKLEHLS